MRRLSLLLVCIGLLSAAAVGQSKRYVQIAARYLNSRFYHECTVLPGGSSPEAHVLFRIPNDRMIFMRSREATPDREFVADVVVSVEFYNGNERISEEVWRGEHYAASYDQTLNKDLDLEGHVSFALEPGSYAYRLRFSDENAEREMVLPLRRVSVPDFTDVAVGKGFIAREIVENGGKSAIKPANLGSNASYGEDAYLIMPVSLPADMDPEAVVVQKQLRKLDETDLEREGKDRQKAMERALRRRGDDRLVFEPEAILDGGRNMGDSSTAPEHRWLPMSESASTFENGLLVIDQPEHVGSHYLLSIDLDGAKLANGTYVLEVGVSAGGEEKLARTRFGTHWRNMPISLNDPDVAIENLGFIIEKSEVRAMRKGNRSEKIGRFEAFWKERDPTSDTEYNELLEEYYRRIDHAAFTFRTGSGAIPNGLDSDRSKVYVVEGPPDDVARTFPPGGGVAETWTYNNGRKFIFEAGSSVDEFKLVRGS